ncbi:MAG: orotidine-5'-phosphate decarboxylase, partial [Oscillospiraceae bacterium]
DATLDYIPEYITSVFLNEFEDPLEAAANSILEFNKGLIDALCDVVPAVKLQCAYYEMYGWYGVKTLAETITYAKQKGMYVITDGKRNDIGATMEAYATAHIGKVIIGGNVCEPFGADSLTVNGYLGTDGILPLKNVCEENGKSIFVLCKTSNKSSGELQDKLIGTKPVYEIMGEMCESWGKDTIGENNYSCVGAVVGATYPEQLKELRAKMPHTFFLVPGYGAQGGGGKDAANAFDKNGIGAIVNSSRGIMCAYKNQDANISDDYRDAARKEAIRMRDDLNKNIK